MNSETQRILAIASVLAALLSAASLNKLRSAHRPIPEAQRILPIGSSVVVPEHNTAPAREADPNAQVSDGPPRMLHLDPARTNRSPFRGPAAPSLSVLIDLHEPIQTAPAFFADGTIVVGTLAGSVYGIRLDGTLVFTTNLDGRVYASPLIIGNRAYLGSDENRFVSLSASGSIIWSLSTDGDTDTSATLTSDNALVFAAKNTLYSVRQDGTVLWRVRAKRKIYSSPAVASDGTIFVGAQDHRMYGIERTGAIRFASDLGNDIDCAPSIDERGAVYVGLDGGSIASVDQTTGRVAWKADVGGHVRLGLTVTRSHDVVAGVYGPSPKVVCVDGKTGEVLWSFAVPGTGANEHGVHGSPVEDRDGNLYFGGQDNAVYSLTASGELRWKVGTGGDMDAPIVLVADGVLLAASDDGKVYRVVEP